MDALEIASRNEQVHLQAPRRARRQQRRDSPTARRRESDLRGGDQAVRGGQADLCAGREGPRVEDVAAARAAYRRPTRRCALAQRQFDDARLLAPANGVVEDRILEPGDVASPATPVVTMALPNPLWVRAYAPESALGRLRLGMRARARVSDSYPDRHYDGWVRLSFADR